MHNSLTRLRSHLILALILLLAAIAYWPGLHGGFLFDDFANLPALGDTGPIDNWAAFWRYITSGTADPTGRPLTLLTFLLNAQDWPASAYPFKCTNLVLHLINGTLLYALLVYLGDVITDGKTKYSRVSALIGSSIWLLHPLLVSTTLYIVQREAMLPATCVLSGLLIWLHGRKLLSKAQINSGAICCVIGLGGFTVLGMLAKANGALLPLFSLLIEATLFRASGRESAAPQQHTYRNIIRWLAVIPSVAILMYLAYIGIHGALSGEYPEGRTWTYGQRILTEPRILIDYLGLLWLPRPFSSGLFNDQYVASSSLWHPITTLPSILAVLSLITYGWRLRRRHPALAFAILFFFTGQLIESTSIPLELYYEHRNYLPALVMFWPLGLWLADTRSLRAIKRILMIALPIVMAIMTHTTAQVWGNQREQSLLWARINPYSPRAQTWAAQVEMQNGQPLQAIDRLEKALVDNPNEPQLALNMVGARCMTGGVSPNDISAIRTSMLTTSSMGSLFVHWFDRVLPVALAGSCPGFTVETIQSAIDAGLQNPRLSAGGFRQDFIYMQGRIALAQNDPHTALVDFNKALDSEVRPGFVLNAAATLGRAGYPAEGLCMLDHYQRVLGKTIAPRPGMPMLHELILEYQSYWPKEIARLRDQLLADSSSQQSINLYSSQCEDTINR